MSNSETIKILHLSDLHFGWDGNQADKDNRKIALTSLIEKVANLNSDWKPNCICITGDIGWKGVSTDYTEAAIWINSLLSSLNISVESLFLCPGNHDINRQVALEYIRPSKSEEADRVLRIPLPKYLLNAFEAYSYFCDSIGIPKLSYGTNESNLFGIRKYGFISFCTINSAWFSQDNYDKGNLWLGLPLIKNLIASGQLSLINNQRSDEICISLLHHPKEWLNESEQRADDLGRENTFDYLSRRCHLILTGHTHGEVRKADRFAEGAWHLSGGAAFAGASHFNSFRIIKVESDRFVYRSFEYDPRSSDNCWLPKDEPTDLNFFFSVNSKVEAKQELSNSLNIFRERSLLSAQQLIQDKSRAIKPFGELPETLPLEVLQINRGQHHNFSSDRNLIRNRQYELKLPLSVAVKRSRKTLILGDLGSGKSTLSATHVQNTLQENPKSFAIIIPATAINETPYLTVKGLLTYVSDFYNEQINPAGLQFDIEKLLSEKIETTIIIDGLDEVSHSHAVKILERLADIADNWSNTQVLATGRPVELQGINYERWNTLLVSSLEEDKKHSFLKEEAKSEGYTESEANRIADKLLYRLKNLPNLNQLANTPLVIRLVYPRLNRSEKGESLSLGDILYDLVHERLGEWNLKDRKESATRNFETEFPDAFSRALLFGQLALIFSTQGHLSIDAVKFQLQNLIKNYSQHNYLNLAGEAYDFLVKTGLITTSSNQIEFTFQPLFETLSGLGLIALLQQNLINSQKMESIHWRVISFFAAGLRRKGLLEANVSLLEDYIKQIFKAPEDVPIVAYIISESQNEVLANTFIEIINKFESDPIVFLQYERTQSARAIAETLKLAGQKGFDWYYSRFLDPRYPYIRRGSWGIDEIFSQWALISISNLSEYEKEKLRKVIRPHIQSGSGRLISIIREMAILIPDAFSTEERLWFYGSLVLDTDFSTIAEKLLFKAHASGDAEIVNKVLIEHARIGYENSALSAHLWLKLNERLPPISIIKALIYYKGYRSIYWDLDTAIGEVIQRIGINIWKSFLRFYLFDSNKSLASGAAIALYNLGERSLNLLIPPLLNDMHDGKSSRHIEQILDHLLHGKNESFLRNLAQKIATKLDNYSDSGAPSGWWRLFLSRLSYVDNGSELLARSVGGIGTFIFPRYPEIRQQFRDLLDNDKGKRYQEALLEKLSDLDPTIRLGAAMILAICSPNQESRAIDIILNYDYRRGMWHEWLTFLLTVSFEPSILVYIKSKVPDLTPDGQALALTILYRNNIPLEVSEYDLLSEAVVDIGKIGFILDKTFISTDFAFKSLLKIISGNSIDKASRAANYLQEYHNEKLSIDQKAMCAILYLENRSFFSDFLEKQISILKTDKLYAEEVKKASDTVKNKLGKKPLLELIHQSVIEQVSWGEVVWRLICDNSKSISIEIEDAGKWLLDYGKFNPKVGKSIGKAAKKFFEKEEGLYSKIEAKQWLAILADEFVGLPTQTLKNILSSNSYIYPSATAIIARIGEDAYTLKPHESVGSVPHLIYSPEIKLETRSELISTLNEQTFDSDKINPQLCETLEKLLLHSQLTNKEIAKISVNGKFGVLAATVLTLVNGKNIDIKNYLKIFEIRIFDKVECSSKLIKLCHHGLASILENNKVKTNKYLKILDVHLKEQGESIMFAANEILRLTGKLGDSQLKVVFDYLASDLPNIDDKIDENLVAWIANLDKKNQSINLAKEIENALKMLYNSSSIKSGFKSSFYYLFFPLAYWKVLGKSDDISTQVFLRGLKFTFLQHSHNEGIEKTSKILKKIQPLLKKSSKQIIEQTIEEGKQSEDFEVRSICHLLALKG